MGEAARNRPRPAASRPAKGKQRQNSPSTQPDALIHERTRLGIVSALAATERVSFVELRSLLGATDGNVSAHTRKLEDGGYVVSHKRFEGRVPRTEYELTDSGRAALEKYLDHMEALIRKVRRA